MSIISVPEKRQIAYLVGLCSVVYNEVRMRLDLYHIENRSSKSTKEFCNVQGEWHFPNTLLTLDNG